MEAIYARLRKELVPDLSVRAVLGLAVFAIALRTFEKETEYNNNFGVEATFLWAREITAISSIVPGIIGGLFVEACKIQSVANFANRRLPIPIIQKIFAAVMLVSAAAFISIEIIIWCKSRKIKLHVEQALNQKQITIIHVALSTFSGLFRTRKTTTIQLVINPKKQGLLIATKKKDDFFSSEKEDDPSSFKFPDNTFHFLYENIDEEPVKKEIGKFINMLALNKIISANTVYSRYDTDPAQEVQAADNNYAFLQKVDKLVLQTISYNLNIEGIERPVKVLLVSNPKSQFSYIKSTQDDKCFGPFTAQHTLFFAFPKNPHQEKIPQFIEKVKAAVKEKAEQLKWDLNTHPLLPIHLSDDNADLLDNPEAFSIAPKSAVDRAPEPLSITAT